MGAAQKRKQIFLGKHPICCFCGGNKPATTIDHVPNRACFPKRVGPEDFEFPACSECQTRFRQEEHFLAFFVRMSDRDERNYDRETSKRLIEGIKNNLPHLVPSTRLSGSQKRRGLRNFGLSKPSHVVLSDIPMAAFPAETDSVIRIAATKIALALFYRHKRVPAKSTYWVSSYWTQSADQKTLEKWSEFARKLPSIEIGKRSNADLGNQFLYRWAEEEKGHSEIFFAIAQFGEGLTLCMIITQEAVWDEEGRPHWIQVEDWAEKKFSEEWLGLYEKQQSRAAVPSSV